MSSSTTTVTLKPTAGFCVKSTTVQPGIHIPKQQAKPDNLLEPGHGPSQIAIPKGFKVFVNIAWDANVPAPPEADEETIQRAMKGEDPEHLSSDGWYVPVVVSDGRQDTDKSGKPALVFDCVFNNSIRSRTVYDQDFKLFIVELALQRLEAQANLTLSRHIGTPNIVSKGPLAQRTISVPTILLNGTSSKSTSEHDGPALLTSPSENEKAKGKSKSKGKGKALIEEVDPTPTTTKTTKEPKSILKKTTTNKSTEAVVPPKPLSWTWDHNNNHLELKINVPSMTHDLIPHTTLDLEPRRILLQLPHHPLLDINLQLSDAEIVVLAGGADAAGSLVSKGYLGLKRQREFDVDKASAEWRVAEGVLAIRA